METTDEIRKIIGPVLDDFGFELVDVQLRRESGGIVLRIIIYKDDGVSLGDCTKVSREIGYLFEVDDPISGAYTLEVSSPGLDRPLVTGRDFERNIGKKVKIVFDDSGDLKTVIGVILFVKDNENGVFLQINNENKDLEINLAHIRNARLVIEF